MPKALGDLFFATDPIDSLLSIYSECGHRDAIFRFSVLAVGPEGLLGRNARGGSGKYGNPVAGGLLA